MKSKFIIIICLLAAGFVGYSQETKRPTTGSITITDSLFVAEIYPVLTRAIETIKDSDAPAKKAIPAMEQLNAVITYLNNKFIEQAKKSK